MAKPKQPVISKSLSGRMHWVALVAIPLVALVSFVSWKLPARPTSGPSLAAVSQSERSEIDRSIQIITNALNNIKDGEDPTAVVGPGQQPAFKNIADRSGREVALSVLTYQRLSGDSVRVEFEYKLTLFQGLDTRQRAGRAFLAFRKIGDRWVLIGGNLLEAIA